MCVWLLEKVECLIKNAKQPSLLYCRAINNFLCSVILQTLNQTVVGILVISYSAARKLFFLRTRATTLILPTRKVKMRQPVQWKRV